MVSVITPVFNNVKFIASCIDSYLGQQCSDSELVIIDGGSTDGTLEIIKEYAGKHPQIRWISETDKGQADAINKGIQLAQGDIIGFLNVDDFYEPNVLTRAIELFRCLQEPSFIAGNCDMIDANGKLIYTNKPADLSLVKVLTGLNRFEPPINPSAYFYHKRIHQLIGGYTLSETHTLDIEFIIRYLKIGRILYFDEHWGNFRFIEGTKTHTDHVQQIAAKRYKALLKKFYDELSLNRKLQVRVLVSYWQIAHFASRILKKIQKIITHV